MSRIALTAAAILVSISAHAWAEPAYSVTQDVQGGTPDPGNFSADLFMPQFNGNLGNLNAVSISYALSESVFTPNIIQQTDPATPAEIESSMIIGFMTLSGAGVGYQSPDQKEWFTGQLVQHTTTFWAHGSFPDDPTQFANGNNENILVEQDAGIWCVKNCTFDTDYIEIGAGFQGTMTTTFFYTPFNVPEPASLAILAPAVLALGAARKMLRA